MGYLKAAVICQIMQYESLNVCVSVTFYVFFPLVSGICLGDVHKTFFFFFFVPPYCSLSIRGHFRALGTVSMATVTADKESVLRQGCERTCTLVSCGTLLCLLPSISFVKWDAIFVCFLSWAFFFFLVHIIKLIRLLVANKAYYTTFKDFFITFLSHLTCEI